MGQVAPLGGFVAKQQKVQNPGGFLREGVKPSLPQVAAATLLVDGDHPARLRMQKTGVYRPGVWRSFEHGEVAEQGVAKAGVQFPWVLFLVVDSVPLKASGAWKIQGLGSGRLFLFGIVVKAVMRAHDNPSRCSDKTGYSLGLAGWFCP